MGPNNSPTTSGPCASQQGCLTWLEEAAATWEISGSCGKLAVGERPLSPTNPPSARNCLHHIREDRALERKRMGEGVGRQVPARSLRAQSPATASQPELMCPTLGCQESFQEWSPFLPRAQTLTAGAQCWPAKAGAPGCFLLPTQRRRLRGPPSFPGGMAHGARAPQTQDVGPGVHTWGTSRTDGTLAPLEVSSSGHDARSEGTRVFLLSPLSRASAPPGVFMSCHKPVPLDSATLPWQPRFPFRTPDPRGPISFRTGKEHNPLRYGIWLCPQTQHPGQRPSNLHPCRNSPLTSDLWSSGR